MPATSKKRKEQEKPVPNMGAEILAALKQIEHEKGIDKEVIVKTIEGSLEQACKKSYGANANIIVNMDRVTGDIRIVNRKDVVDEIEDEACQMSTEEAKQINPEAKAGDTVDITIDPADFGRIAAGAAKQFVVTRFREAEREILYSEFITKEREVITGIVSRRDKRNYIITLGKMDAVLLPSEQIPGEELAPQSRVKVFVTDVRQTTKGPSVTVSRTHPELVRRLFEQEVPEVADGIVEIKTVAREAGNRTKIAVISNRDGVDPVGACVGPNGSRVNIVVGELKGEKIDIIRYDEDASAFITSALSPSKPIAVVLNHDDRTARVAVPDHQLSLAIGREGQNVRLAAKLTGWRIDIKSETAAKETGFIDEALLADADGADSRRPVYRKTDSDYDDYDEDEDEDEYDDDYDEDEYDDDEEEDTAEPESPGNPDADAADAPGGAGSEETPAE